MERVANQKSVCGVFWDIENVAVPKNVSVKTLVNNLRSQVIMKNDLHEIEINCACDARKLSQNVSMGLNSYGVNVVHVDSTSKNAADDKLKELMNKFVDYHSESTIILLSGDINYLNFLRGYKQRHSITIFLIFSAKASNDLIQCADKVFVCKNGDFIEYIPNIKIGKPESYKTLLVKGFNISFNEKGRLCKELSYLTENCGGKVKFIGLDHAYIEYSSNADALRSQQRINGYLWHDKVLTSQLVPPKANYFIILKGFKITQKDKFTVRKQLEDICSDVSGVIKSLNNTIAIISFPTHDLALKGLKKMQGLSINDLEVKFELKKADEKDKFSDFTTNYNGQKINQKESCKNYFVFFKIQPFQNGLKEKLLPLVKALNGKILCFEDKKACIKFFDYNSAEVVKKTIKEIDNSTECYISETQHFSQNDFELANMNSYEMNNYEHDDSQVHGTYNILMLQGLGKDTELKDLMNLDFVRSFQGEIACFKDGQAWIKYCSISKANEALRFLTSKECNKKLKAKLVSTIPSLAFDSIPHPSTSNLGQVRNSYKRKKIKDPCSVV